MAINTYPAVASPVKSVQRGSAAGAGTVTITSVDISKSFVNVQGTVGSGTVSASFGLSAAGSGNVVMRGVGTSHVNWSNNQSRRPNGANVVANNSLGTAVGGGGSNYNYAQVTWDYTAPVNAFGYNVNAGSNNLVAGVVQGYLSNATSLVVSGACRWEVVEYN